MKKSAVRKKNKIKRKKGSGRANQNQNKTSILLWAGKGSAKIGLQRLREEKGTKVIKDMWSFF